MTYFGSILILAIFLVFDDVADVILYYPPVRVNLLPLFFFLSEVLLKFDIENVKKLLKRRGGLFFSITFVTVYFFAACGYT